MFNLVSDIDSSASPPNDCEAPDSDSAVPCRSSHHVFQPSARANSWPSFIVNGKSEENQSTRWIHDKQLASNSRIASCRQRFVLLLVGIVCFLGGLFVASTFLATATTFSDTTNKGNAEVLLSSLLCSPVKSEVSPSIQRVVTPSVKSSPTRADAAVLRRCVDATSTDRCALSSSVIVGIGTYFANHHKVVAMRDSWLRSVGQWMVLSDTFDPTIPTTQVDWRGLRESTTTSTISSDYKYSSSASESQDHLRAAAAIAHTTMAPALDMEEVEAEWKRVHPFEDAPPLREGSGTWLGRQDGDQRFLMLPLLLNDTWNTRVSTENGIRFRPPHIPPADSSSSFDWLFIADDDTYVFMAETLKVLAHFDPMKPYLLGEVKPRMSSQQNPEEFQHCFCPLDIRPRVKSDGSENSTTITTPAPEPPICWTLEAKERAQEYCKRNESSCLKSPVDGVPIQAPETKASRCEFAHIYGGYGLILSRGLMNLASRSHWEWCLRAFRLNIGGDWKISRCVYELGIAPTDIANTKSMREEPNGIGWVARHWADQYHVNKIQEMQQWDEAAVEVRKWETTRKFVKKAAQAKAQGS